MTEVNVNPTPDERIMRIRGRITRLTAAIERELAKANPDEQRVQSLTAEREQKVQTIKSLFRGIL